MTTSKKPSVTEPAKQADNAATVLCLHIPPSERESREDEVIARYHTASASVQAAEAIVPWISEHARPDPTALHLKISDMVKAVQGGDMKQIEAMLLSQAIAMQTLFVSLSKRAALNVGHHLDATDCYLRLAFKAQAQSRSTLEALGEIKNPRSVAFVRQGNFAAGDQTVNNTMTLPSTSDTRTQEIQIPQSKLLEHDHEQRLDTRTQGTTSGANSTLEAVDKEHGRKKRGRKTSGKP